MECLDTENPRFFYHLLGSIRVRPALAPAVNFGTAAIFAMTRSEHLAATARRRHLTIACFSPTNGDVRRCSPRDRLSGLGRDFPKAANKNQTQQRHGQKAQCCSAVRDLNAKVL